MSLEIRHLKLLLAVNEDGSLTRAARRLHLTQSALSRQLRDVEKTLGRPLFLREKKQMRLTAEGERLLRSAQEILDELDSAERESRPRGDRVQHLLPLAPSGAQDFQREARPSTCRSSSRRRAWRFRHSLTGESTSGS